jgi:hypothetical protein
MVPSSSAAPVAIGPLRLVAPEGCEIHSSHESPERVFALAAKSPDYTIYHSQAYIEFSRRNYLDCALVVVTRAGELLFGMPVYPETNLSFGTLYSGLLLPDPSTEKALKRGVSAFYEFFAANTHLRQVRFVQSMLSRGACDRRRRELIDYLVTTLAPSGAVEHLFTRVIELATPGAATAWQRATRSGMVSVDDLDADLLRTYDGDVRNQIRQADRGGLRIRYFVLAEAAESLRTDAYDAYQRIHEASWQRTGLSPHTRSYWQELSRFVSEVGATDIVVLALDGEEAVAGATAQLAHGTALYWSGGSTPDGLRKRGNPLCLHALISLVRRLGAERFEVGRFSSSATEKEQRITHYKSQFGGSVVRMANVCLNRRTPRTIVAENAWKLSNGQLTADVIFQLLRRAWRS